MIKDLAWWTRQFLKRIGILHSENYNRERAAMQEKQEEVKKTREIIEWTTHNGIVRKVEVPRDTDCKWDDAMNFIRDIEPSFAMIVQQNETNGIKDAVRKCYMYLTKREAQIVETYMFNGGNRNFIDTAERLDTTADNVRWLFNNAVDKIAKRKGNFIGFF